MDAQKIGGWIERTLPALKYLAALLVGGGATFGTTTFMADPEVKAPISEARQQMLKSGAVDAEALEAALARTVQEHFKAAGYPCDPVRAEETPARTLKKAKICAEAQP